MLLLIYLRGLCSRFGNIFIWKDKIIMQDLGINRKMLQRCRLLLQEKGIIDFVSGIGQASTEYLILDIVLAPERVDKTKHRVDKIPRRSGHNVHSIYKSYEKSKEKENCKRFQGITNQDRIILKEKGIL
jgi:hypothetical protein